MMKITIFLFIAALAYTSVKAVDDDDNQQLGSSSQSQVQSGFSNFPAFPAFPKMNSFSADDIKNLAPKNAGEHVQGHYQSSSSSIQTINGKVVENKHESKSVDNDDGDVTETKSSN